MATLGYVRSSNGPDLAQVGVNEQLVSHTFPNTTGETLRITSISAWVGNWGGTATMRFGIWSASSSSAAPGALLARTVEFSPTVNYMDGGGGQLRTANLETPYDLAPGQVIALGVASRNNQAGIAMFQASAITQPNENFYRKSISGTTLQTVVGSSASNEGHLAIYVTGTTNQPPTAPTIISPAGNADGTVTPLMTLRHNDPDGNNSSQAQVVVQYGDGSGTRWSHTRNAVIADGSTWNLRYGGSTLLYYTPYRWQARTWDSHGVPGPMSSWQSFTLRHTNRSPNQPSNVTGLGAVIGTRNLVVGADFSDPDYPLLSNGQAWERFEQKQVIVRRVSDNLIVLNTGVINTTTAERNNARSSTAFTLPAFGTLYRWEERHFDRSGASSAWYIANVQAHTGGTVEEPTSPAGRVTNMVNPGDINFVYQSSSGLNGNLVRVGVFNEGGGQITVRDVTTATTPNVNKVVGWGALWNDLDTPGFPLRNPGMTYLYAVKVRDTNNQWTDWSPFQTLNLNGAPTTPSLWAPNDQPRSALGGFSVRTTDDQPPSEVTVELEVYNDTETLIGSGPMPHNFGHSLNNVYSMSPAAQAAIVTSHGTYTWRARAYDGFLYSPWSAPFTLNYFAVPSVAITAPAGPTITTSQPLFTWTSSNQTGWRVRGYDGERLVYDTGEQSGGAQSHAIQPVQYWIGGERWNNNEEFRWEVSVTDASTLWGHSDPLTLTLEYIPPDPLIVDVTGEAFPGVNGTHYIHLTHSPSEYDQEDFIAYVWSRVEIDGPAGNEIPGAMHANYARLTSSAQVILKDFDVTSNQWYRYSVRQEIQQGVDVIESDPVFAEMMVSWHGTLLHMPFDPESNYLWLKYSAPGGDYEPNRQYESGFSAVQPLNRHAPVQYAGRSRRLTLSGEYTLIANNDASHIDQLDTLDRLYENQFADTSPDGRPHIMCWREGRGGRKGRLYVAMVNWEDRTGPGLTTQVVQLEFEERYHAHGGEE